MFFSSCGKHLEIEGGSISGYDGPRWRVRCHLIGEATYNRFKERIKVLFVSDGSTGCGSRFKISYSEENFSKMSLISCCGSENDKTLTPR